jgi:hypothetical protein
VSNTLWPRAGDIVVVRPPAEILATLDDEASADGLPLMPEMLQYIGRSFRVTARAEKVCDTTHGTGNRRLDDTVLLEDLRCDGSAHGGCQAGCRLFWRASWLRPVDSAEGVADAIDSADDSELEERTHAATTTEREVDGRLIEPYRCQATRLVDASEPFAPPGQMKYRLYLREVQCGNVGIRRFLRVLMRAVLLKGGLASGLRSRLPLRPRSGSVAPSEPLHLGPGDLVRVKSKKGIAETLDVKGKNRGLAFAWEMLPHCGGTYRVKQRVERIINEHTGEMIEFASDCVILEGVACTGDWSGGRWFCARAIYPYWREAWLERVGDNETAGTPSR